MRQRCSTYAALGPPGAAALDAAPPRGSRGSWERSEQIQRHSKCLRIPSRRSRLRDRPSAKLQIEPRRPATMDLSAVVHTNSRLARQSYPAMPFGSAGSRQPSFSRSRRAVRAFIMCFSTPLMLMPRRDAMAPQLIYSKRCSTNTSRVRGGNSAIAATTAPTASRSNRTRSGDNSSIG
jgi:hypothetical protein